MKVLKFSFLFLGFPFLISCDKEIKTEAIRRIINETEYAIELRIFGDDDEFTYSVDALDTLEIRGNCFCCVLEYCELGWTTGLANGEIIFDNQRIQRFTDLPNSCQIKSINADPYNGCYGYDRSSIDGGILIFTYKITEEDYQNAEVL